MRNMLAVIAGFLAGSICIFWLETSGTLFFPTPPGLDLSKPEMLTEYLKSAPLAVLWFALLAQTAGFVVGGFVTGLLTVSNKHFRAFIYGVLALGATILNLVNVPHPAWFSRLAVLLPIPLALLGVYLAGKLVKAEARTPIYSSHSTIA